MEKKILWGCLLALVMGSCEQQPTPPRAKVVNYVMEEFGHKRVDPYFWMRLSDEQKNAERPDAQTQDVIAYLNEENAYADAYMAPYKSLEDQLYGELTFRLAPDDSSVPYLYNGYSYTTRYESGQNYPVYYRTAVTEGAEEVLLLDVNTLAEGQKFCSVTGLSVSPDNKWLAYGTDFVSRRIYTLHFKNLETGELFADTLKGTDGHLVWAADSKHVYYVGKDYQTLRAERIYRHELGSPQEQDEMLFYEQDETYDISLDKTTSEKYILVFSSQTLATEINYIEASDVKGQFKLFYPREKDHLYEVDHINGKFYIKTNKDGALNFKLMTVDEDKVATGKWTELIPTRPDVLLEDFALFDDYLVLNERINGLLSLRVIDEKRKKDYYIDFDDPSYASYIGVNKNPSSSVLRYDYASMLTPPSVIDFDMATGEQNVRKVTEVPGYNPSQYEMERIWAVVRDGTKVPVNLIHKKDFKRDGTSPLLLYAYGSYGISMDPLFSSSVFSLLDRGFVYAIAQIRGGADMGRQWYEDGKLLKKMNTFTDFNDCARYLVEQGYTSTDRLFAKGGSAGGLLMGACINLEPDLYKGVIANVPFVDVVSTMMDETIPLTTFEWDEWGDPRTETYYHYMLSYSPYDNVEAKAYPNLIVTSGYWDSQVQYWEPAKWVAKLRASKTDDNVLLFKCDMDSGHGGASGRFLRLQQTAMEYAFILSLLNE